MYSTDIELPTKEEINTWLDEQVEKKFIKDKKTWIDWQFNLNNSCKENDVYHQISNDESTIDENVAKHFHQCMNPKYVKLFYYTSASVACKIIKDGMLKGTDPYNTNDPFEFFPAGNRKLAIDKMDAQILCFSTKVTSAALWGHYAEQHKGVCFVFSIPLIAYFGSTNNNCHWRIASHKETKPIKNCLYMVEYCSDRWKFGFHPSESALCSKDVSWQWENEIRMICDASDCDYVDDENRKFYKFPMEYLESIICGVKNTNKDRLKYLCKCHVNREIVFDQCTYSQDKFEVYNTIVSDTYINMFPQTYYQNYFKSYNPFNNYINNSNIVNFEKENMQTIVSYY